ncbi:hypothetical protein ACOTW9_09440, partial [Enterobacter cloacae complex sp. IR5378]|uniref:hypothetical protein n=1 Tax=Enterobacter cloacae complex sp. IR5378 TaxID=3412349 RepID=UPI003B99C5CB
EQDDKGWDARKRAYCLKIQPATGSFARNLIYSTKPRVTVQPSDSSLVSHLPLLKILTTGEAVLRKPLLSTVVLSVVLAIALQSSDPDETLLK